MEEMLRLHPDVPFGWMLWLSDYLAARRRARCERLAIDVHGDTARPVDPSGAAVGLNCPPAPH